MGRLNQITNETQSMRIPCYVAAFEMLGAICKDPKGLVGPKAGAQMTVTRKQISNLQHYRTEITWLSTEGVGDFPLVLQKEPSSVGAPTNILTLAQ